MKKKTHLEIFLEEDDFVPDKLDLKHDALIQMDVAVKAWYNDIVVKGSGAIKSLAEVRQAVLDSKLR